MSRTDLRLPESLHKQLREFAKQEGISINQIVASALSEKMAVFAGRLIADERLALIKTQTRSGASLIGG